MRRLLTVLSLLVLASGASAQDFNRYYPPQVPGLTSSGTAITSTLPFRFPDGTAAAPAVSFTSDPTIGIFKTGGRIGFSLGSLETFTMLGGAFGMYPTYYIGWGAGNSYSGFDVKIYRDGIQGARSKALTDAAAATAFATVAVPTNGWIGGELIWAATSLSGADQLTTTGRIRFAGATTNVTPVCTINVVGTDLPAVSAGVNTLVCTWTNVVAAQTCALSVTCTNDLAGVQAITLYGRTDMPILATLVFP